MTYYYDREYLQAPPLSDWLQSFADQQLKNSGKVDDKKNNNLDSVEAMVIELRKRVGLDLINDENVKTASLNKSSEEKIKGGLGDGKKDSEFDAEQIEKGVEVEKEHSPNMQIRKEISKDHLTENDHYYDYLEKMEEKMDKESKAAFVSQLVSIAEAWEELGNYKMARKVDVLINKMAEEAKEEEDIFNKHPKMGKFIEQLLKSRGGFIDDHAVFDNVVKILSETVPNLKLKEKDIKAIMDFISKAKKETNANEKKEDGFDGVAVVMSLQDSKDDYDVFGGSKR